MTLEENIAFQRARIKGWGLIEEGWQLLRDCFSKHTDDYRYYDQQTQHPRVCREMAEKELERLLKEKVYYDPCQVCNPFGVGECGGHLALAEKRLQIVRIRPDGDERIMDEYDNRTYADAETDLLRYRKGGPPGWRYEIREETQ